ncbi:Z394 [Hepatospora eriocheir]|uniref:Z394 n=1 Tax=Hepatospora eriocheir TaxID=1081669 RepID=A0A1X0QBX1_9MICR|nr:Z394 [Hepatospora eriocheir]
MKNYETCKITEDYESEETDPIAVYYNRRGRVPVENREFWDFFVNNFYKDFPQFRNKEARLDGTGYSEKINTRTFIDDILFHSNSLSKTNSLDFFTTQNDENASINDNTATTFSVQNDEYEFEKLQSKPFACPSYGCKKAYTSKHGLDYHLKKGHKFDDEDASKPFKCNFNNCKCRYKTKNGLKYHLSKQHQQKGNKI